MVRSWPISWTDIQGAEKLQQKFVGDELSGLVSLLLNRDGFVPVALLPELEQHIKSHYDKSFYNQANNIISYLSLECDSMMQAMIQNKKLEIIPY